MFGPRGTGKSTLFAQTFPHARHYDLLEEKTYLTLMRDSSILEQENPGQNELIIIDEVQKLPKLLDEVQRLVFKNKHRFLLTGSSARKLKRGGANLLGGRARELHLFPLVSQEIPDFDLNTFLNRGGLPSVYLSEDPLEDLKSYISLYLREEIANEALTRRVDLFARFLDVMALNCGEELHFQNLSSDCGVKAKTLQNYVEILEDTLLGFQVLPFEATKIRKAITRSKFYLFDLGVTRVLAKRGEVVPQGELFGKAFEHFIMLETRAALSYLKKDLPMQYWRTKSSFEVDLILGDSYAFEIKSTDEINPRHLKGLRALREEALLRKYAVIAFVPHRRIIDGIAIIPWQEFLAMLWGGEFS
ncbi:AAA family ATPase [Bdellovibrionota bacterium FG-2]